MRSMVEGDMRGPKTPSGAARHLPRNAGEDPDMRAPEKTVRRARDLRRRMSLPEVVLWQSLRQGRLAGLRFRRQHPIGPYVLDFYCAAAHLAIEVDGFAHDTEFGARRDEHRDGWLAERGVTVLRVRASDVSRDDKLEGILLGIAQAASGAPSGPHLPHRRGRILVWA
jgi:very-short-patch-repair endonuclease